MNKDIFKYFVLIMVFFLLMGCEETVILDTQQVEPVIVIEGLVTNTHRNQYVRVTKSVNFYANKGFEAVEDALVTVTDNEGNSYNYSYSEESESGYYIADEPFEGIIGNTYTLTVKIEGDTYTASDELLPVTAIDSLGVELNEDEYEDPEDPGYYYEVLLFAKEPQDTKDYYYFRFYRNNNLILDNITDIYYSDDELLGENIDGVTIAGYYADQDTVTAEMYSISRRGYIYYNDLATLLINDGGLFGSPPVNPRTNLSNGAMGFFQVSAVSEKTIIVKGN